jgi:hypothetical protein
VGKKGDSPFKPFQTTPAAHRVDNADANLHTVTLYPILMPKANITLLIAV